MSLTEMPANVCGICGGTFYCAPEQFQTHMNLCREKMYALKLVREAKIEEPPKCDPRPEPTGKRYTYLAIDVGTCLARFDAQHKDSYISDDEQGRLLFTALNEGYRWIYTIDNKAIWEKEWNV